MTTTLNSGLGKLNQWTGAMVLVVMLSTSGFMVTSYRDAAVLKNRVDNIETILIDGQKLLSGYVRADVYESETVNVHRRITEVDDSSIERDARQQKELEAIWARFNQRGGR